MDISEYVDLSGWKLASLAVLASVALSLWLLRKIRRAIRKRRSPTLHPNLMRYGETEALLTAKRRAEAARIIATSSREAIAGYEITRQVEAVFVDGMRRAEDAIEALKAVAAMKGANAVTNVRQERNAVGKYAASGDAVIAAPVGGATGGGSPPVAERPGDGDDGIIAEENKPTGPAQTS